MLSILTNALANFALANALRMKRLYNACAAKPLANVSLVTFIRQSILNSQDCFIRNGFARIRNGLFAFVCMNTSKSLRMSYDHYKYLAINSNILRLLTKCCENNRIMLS